MATPDACPAIRITSTGSFDSGASQTEAARKKIAPTAAAKMPPLINPALRSLMNGFPTVFGALAA